MLKVAIQGGKASFHDIATHHFFNGQEIEIYENDTFRNVCAQVADEEVDYALLAIENSIAGTILLNYSLVEEYKLNIIGDYKLRIKQNMMALPGQSLKDIKLVRSHYMALLQCKEFLSQYPEMVIEDAADTADSAKQIRNENLKGVAAIAGERAAELYGLEILAESIETIKLNYTRFFVLAKTQKHYVEKNKLNKATLSFQLSHEVGALAKALQVIVDSSINLTKIQSVPIIGKPDQYTFYIDCEYSAYRDLLLCYKNLGTLIVNPNILGEYQSFEINYDSTSSR